MDVDQDNLLGNALILDTTDLTPAFLNYPVMETNYGRAHHNIFYSSGTILFYFAPNWASVSQGPAPLARESGHIFLVVAIGPPILQRAC